MAKGIGRRRLVSIHRGGKNWWILQILLVSFIFSYISINTFYNNYFNHHFNESTYLIINKGSTSIEDIHHVCKRRTETEKKMPDANRQSELPIHKRTINNIAPNYDGLFDDICVHM